MTLTLNARMDAVVVPSEAVQAGQKGPFVYVVKADQSVEAREVKPGAMAGNKIVIESGLKAGETVVTDGQLLLAPGMHIFALPPGGMPAAPCRPSRERASHEPVADLYRASDHDDAAWCSPSCCSGWWRTGRCRWRRCRASITRPSR